MPVNVQNTLIRIHIYTPLWKVCSKLCSPKQKSNTAVRYLELAETVKLLK